VPTSTGSPVQPAGSLWAHRPRGQRCAHKGCARPKTDVQDCREVI